MQQDNPLEPIRQQITALDQQLLQLFARRRELSIEVAQTKADAVSPVRDVDRESALLTRLVQQGRELGLDGQYVSRLFHTIIEDSVLRQQAWFQERINPTHPEQVKVAYLGAKGSYSHIAAYHYFERRDRKLVEMGLPNFDAIFTAVDEGQADYGILPVENTSSGAINEVFDLLQNTNLYIVGETTETIAHCLLLADDAKREQITTVFAHPQVHAQCSGYLSKQGWDQQYCASSAEAMTRASSEPNTAAIGSARGGSFYGLNVIEANLANQARNESRFIVVARKSISVPLQVPAKTTLLMATSQQAGALVDALLILKQLGLTMTKLESRPIHGNPWEEMFYLDIAANQESQTMQDALLQLRKITRFIKVLGCYPSDTILPTELAAPALADDPRLTGTAAVQTSAPLYSRQLKPENSQINLNNCQFGGQQLQVIAASNAAVTQAEVKIKEQGGHVLLTDSDDVATTLPTAKVISSETQLANINSHLQLLLIEAAQMANQQLLTQVGKQPRPVLLSRGYGASLQQWLDAAEVILQQGNQQVALLAQRHQDIVDFHDLAELQQLTHLPIVIEPGRADDSATTQANLAKAAASIGVSGVLVSLSEQRQPDDYAVFMKALYA
ncbi:chorismate mutase [Ferrimonas lipolytica]|uniref:Chorismate mutase n=1 Tax=Ferrimonas lipolytica TaxID=2724191 RepID=A0A6H1U9P1_9GAMM|nr:chorismate mutase [Ferrimonas lipolytica]QIZ75548.1 chorismate mutase [Ferrimonas lipolytica]